jgi:hypothetical protein
VFPALSSHELGTEYKDVSDMVEKDDVVEKDEVKENGGLWE